MTNSNGNKLNRIEQILELTALQTQRNREDIVRLEQIARQNTAASAQQRERMDQFIIQAEEDRRLIREIQVEIREIQVEIRGIQTENRRILDHLFGENNE